MTSATGLYHLLVAHREQLEEMAIVGVTTVIERFSLIVWAAETKILRKLPLLQSENTVKFVLTYVHLHNFLCKRQTSSASCSLPQTFNSDTAAKTLVLVNGGWKECPREKY
ncbi:hypothetical protein AVEN_150261-1 [Araneus ventricosus]|uniref:Uncharacterized protein n=1 Tax=Araneus ventricosus TaxID=182803 RepID=A0A4Y2HCY4_ARAVE|nr:hypothetical protein AVEN_150261-1 [Araneus ventricosus]